MNNHRSHESIQTRPYHTSEITAGPLVYQPGNQNGNNPEKDGIDYKKRYIYKPFIRLIYKIKNSSAHNRVF